MYSMNYTDDLDETLPLSSSEHSTLGEITHYVYISIHQLVTETCLHVNAYNNGNVVQC